MSECDIIEVDSGSGGMSRLGQFALSSTNCFADDGSNFVQREGER